jgi:hypothetical protein
MESISSMRKQPMKTYRAIIGPFWLRVVLILLSIILQSRKISPDIVKNNRIEKKLIMSLEVLWRGY